MEPFFMFSFQCYRDCVRKVGAVDNILRRYPAIDLDANNVAGQSHVSGLPFVLLLVFAR